MKVAHVIIGLHIGGAELMLLRLCDSFKAQGVDEHRVISLTDLGEVGVRLRASGIAVETLQMRGKWDLLGVMIKLISNFRRQKPDIVQTWMYHSDLIGGVAARLVGVKHVIWGIRTTDVSSGGGKATIVIRKLCAYLSNVVPDAIVCAAQASRETHIEAGYAPGRMKVISNGFDLERLTATAQERASIREGQGIGPDDMVIGSLGRFNEVKDHSNFIKAAGIVAGRFPKTIFLMVGRDIDRGNAALMAEISLTGHADRFVLLGERKDVPACLKAMDIFCLHSFTEGFPNVLGEAMSMGVPCVTTDVGDAALLLGGLGPVVPARDVRALSDALISLLSASATERAAMGQSVYKRIAENFTMKRTEKQFKDLYDRVYLNRDGN
ncbi:glycosyltransferase family 4 protein [Pseudomonas sp. SDO5522_S412]